MLESLPDNFKPDHVLVDRAKKLDRHYIPTRYPNFHPEGAPMDYYTRDDALRAIEYTKEIIGFCRNKIV